MELLRYRALEPRHVRLRRKDAGYRGRYGSVDAMLLEKRHTVRTWHPAKPVRGPRHREARHGHAPFSACSRRSCSSSTPTVGASTAVAAKPGDVVIDGGACWGYGSSLRGEGGRCRKGNMLRVGPGEQPCLFKENLALNPRAHSQDHHPPLTSCRLPPARSSDTAITDRQRPSARASTHRASWPQRAPSTTSQTRDR